MLLNLKKTNVSHYAICMYSENKLIAKTYHTLEILDNSVDIAQLIVNNTEHKLQFNFIKGIIHVPVCMINGKYRKIIKARINNLINIDTYLTLRTKTCSDIATIVFGYTEMKICNKLLSEAYTEVSITHNLDTTHEKN